MKFFYKNKKLILTIIFITLSYFLYYFFFKESYTIETSAKSDSISNFADTSMQNNPSNTCSNDIYETNNSSNIIESSALPEEKIIVYITGEIKKPGILELSPNSRIADAIDAADGLTENANISDLNLAFKLTDGTKIYVPKINETPPTVDKTDLYVSNSCSNLEIPANTVSLNSTSAPSLKKNVEKININTATQTEFETLTGIGPSTALKIINFRKEHGPFKCIEDIKNVNGIGENKFNKIADFICI